MTVNAAGLFGNFFFAEQQSDFLGKVTSIEDVSRPGRIGRNDLRPYPILTFPSQNFFGLGIGSVWIFPIHRPAGGIFQNIFADAV